MITSEEFVVKIRADIKQAKKELGSLKDLINGIAEGLSEGFEEASKSAEQVTEEAKETAKAKKEVNKEGKETSKSNKQELISLSKMVLVYKAILKVVQSIAKVFKDGISNAYQMSKVTGGGFSEAMDRMSSKTEAIKNAFGSIAVSFITAVEPIISSILDKLFDFISRASLIIAKMLKLPTYLKANGEIMKQWNKNVEQTRKLLGMDELNIFEKQDTAPENIFEWADVGESSGFTGIPVIDDAIQYFSNLWNTSLKPTIDSVWNSLKGIWDNISRTFDNFDFSGWEGAFGGFIDIITTTTDTIFRAIKFITGLPSFQLIKPFFEILGHIISIIVNRAAFITTAINDLLRLLSGDLTGAEFVRATNENIKKHLIDPIVNFVSHIVDIIVDTCDNIIVAIYNLFHPNKKVEHTKMWYNYQMSKNAKANATSDVGRAKDKVGGGSIAVGNWDVKMASGGVVNQPTVALIGEYSNARYNPELVTPENVLQANLDANNQNLISAFAQLTKQIITAIGNVDMSVSISDQVIAQSSARGSEQYYKLTGKSLFV